MKIIPPALRRPLQNIFGYGPSGPGPMPPPAPKRASQEASSTSTGGSGPLSPFSDRVLDKADNEFFDRYGREPSSNEYHSTKYIGICEELSSRERE